MLNTLTNFGDSSSGLGALGLDGRALIIQLITFVLALLILKRYAFKPISKVLNERRELIESGVKLGEEMQSFIQLSMLHLLKLGLKQTALLLQLKILPAIQCVKQKPKPTKKLMP